MAVSMTKSEGVTILTMNSDPQSRWPPLCQILKELCCSPVCCSVSQHLRTVQRSCLSILGTMQIMVGLLNIGLGVILIELRAFRFYSLHYLGFPFWLGALFILFGVSCILSERFSSPCLVIFNVILNLLGVGFAIAGIVIYSCSIGRIYWWSSCDYYQPYYYYRATKRPQTPQQLFLFQKCTEGEHLFLTLNRGINALLIIFSVLELCVTISSAVLGIKALKKTEKEPEKGNLEPELYKH